MDSIIIIKEKWMWNDWLQLMMDFHIPCYEIFSRCKKEKWRLSLLKKSIGYIACKQITRKKKLNVWKLTKWLQSEHVA